jgi:EmrB/QacA subfamily drug resistance transporter
MSTATLAADPPHAMSPNSERRWLVLAIVAIAQLMIVLDATIVNIALPSAQRALHISNADRQWVVTAYTLAFGCLLLLGGRIADYFGRKRAFLIGLAGFAFASALGGLSVNEGMLFAARALQGGFGALMAPAALSIMTTTFTDPKERAQAFGVYGAIAGGGAAVGLLMGGVLTEYATWRWCLLVNAPIAVATMIATALIVKESRIEGNTRYDLPGAASATLGLAGLVYGFTKADTNGWSAPITIAFLLAGVALLALFVVIERRSQHPLLPLRVILDGNRGGSLLASLLTGLAMFGMFLFLTYYLQGTLHYSALRSGVAFLPFSLGIVISAGIASQLLPRFGPRPLMLVGLGMGLIGLLLFTQIGPHTGYLSHVLPGEVVMSLGLGQVFVPLSNTALIGVAPHDAGVASALINTTQQIGGALGTSLLNTIAATATASYIAAHGSSTIVAGTVHGYTRAFFVGAGFIVLALITTAVFMRAGRDDLAAVPDAAPVAA